MSGVSPFLYSVLFISIHQELLSVEFDGQQKVFAEITSVAFSQFVDIFRLKH